MEENLKSTSLEDSIAVGTRVIGTRVRYEQFGVGTVVEIDDSPCSHLVHFDKESNYLHNGLDCAGIYPDNHMRWFVPSLLTIIEPKQENTEDSVESMIEEDINNQKSASQALVDILLKLGYQEIKTGYNYGYDYVTKKMHVFWDETDWVCVTYSEDYLMMHPERDVYFADIDGEPIEVVTAYFQKKLNKKQKKATNKQTPEQQEYELLLAELKEMVAPFYTNNHKDTAKIGKMSFHFNRDNEGLYEEGTTTLYIEGNGNSISITNIREYLYVFVAHGSSYAGYNYHNLPLGTIDVISTIKQWIKLVSETTSYMEFYHREDTNTWATASVPLIEFHHDKMGALLVALQENNIQCSGGGIFEGMATRNSFTINMCSSQQATIKGKQDEYSTILGVIKSCL